MGEEKKKKRNMMKKLALVLHVMLLQMNLCVYAMCTGRVYTYKNKAEMKLVSKTCIGITHTLKRKDQVIVLSWKRNGPQQTQQTVEFIVEDSIPAGASKRTKWETHRETFEGTCSHEDFEEVNERRY